MLTWYYTSAISRQSRAKRNAQSAAAHRAQGEMPLPALDGFNSLKTSTADVRHPPSDPPTAALPAPDPTAPLNQPTQLPLMQSSWGGAGAPHASYGRANRKSAEQLAQERLLSGAAFAQANLTVGSFTADFSAMGGLKTLATQGKGKVECGLHSE